MDQVLVRAVAAPRAGQELRLPDAASVQRALVQMIPVRAERGWLPQRF